jgi:outer membrane protein assembly factor BamB
MRRGLAPTERRFPFTAGAALLLLLVVTACAPLPGESWATFTVDGQYVYVAYKEYVFRVDTASTAIPNSRPVDWVAKSPGNANMYTPPSLAPDGVIFVGAYNREMYAFSPLASPRNAALATWDSPTAGDKYIGGSVVNEALGLLYSGHGDKGIYAYDLKTGAERARFTDMKFGVWSTPVLDAERKLLYVASLDHSLYARDVESLSMVWVANAGSALYDSPVLDVDVLYIGTFAGEFLKISARTGEILQRLRMDGGVWATAVLDNGVLYVGDLRGTFYAIDAKTFTVINKVADAENRFGAIRGRAALATNTVGQRIVIVGSESKTIRAFATTDLSERWTNTADDRILGDVAVVGDVVVFATLSENQLLTGYNIDNGARMWSVAKPNDDVMNRTSSGPAPAMRTAEPTLNATAASN